MDDVLKSDHCESPFGYDKIYWFDEGVIKLENNMAFSFENINKDIIMSEKDEELITFVDFVGNLLILIKFEIFVIWHVIEVVQLFNHVILLSHRNKAFLYHLCFTCLVIMIVIFFFEKFFDKNNDKVNFDIITKTTEWYTSVSYGCVKFFESYQFLSSSSDSLVKILVDNGHKTP